VRFLAAISLLVAFAGLSGGCNKSEDDPSQDKAFADQFAKASAGPKTRPVMPGKAEGAAKMREMQDAASSGAKPGASGGKPDSAATKTDSADKKASGSGN